MRWICRRLRTSFRAYSATLCLIYMLLVTLFHGDLQQSESSLGDMHLESTRRPVEHILYRAQFPPRKYLMHGSDIVARAAILPTLKQDSTNHDHVNMEPEESNNTCVGSNDGVQDKFVEIITAKLYLYSAYYDPRPNDFDNRENGSYVRIMAAMRVKSTKPVLRCKFLMENDSVMVSNVHYYEMCENHSNQFGGFILSSRIPYSNKRPCSVTIEDLNTNRTTKLKVSFDRSESDNFTICVPPLFGKIRAERLVEFVELSRLLGVNKITFYELKITKEVSTVLDHYSRLGFVSVIPWHLPERLEKLTWYHGQLIAIQDCLYRNMYTSQYVAFNDVDEFIIPRIHGSWGELVQSVSHPGQCALQFLSAYYPPARNNDLRSLATTSRTKQIDDKRTKCMVRPELVYEVGIHHVSKPIWAHLKITKMAADVAFIHHYRPCIGGFGMNCKRKVKDDFMKKYSRDLSVGVRQTIKQFESRNL